MKKPSEWAEFISQAFDLKDILSKEAWLLHVAEIFRQAQAEAFIEGGENFQNIATCFVMTRKVVDGKLQSHPTWTPDETQKAYNAGLRDLRIDDLPTETEDR